MKGEAADWYQADKGNITRWSHATAGDGFKERFLARFSTIERLHKWQNELMNLKQKPSESVEIYSAKFKKLLTRLNAATIPNDFQVRMYLQGLKKDLSLLVAVNNPANIDAAIQRAKEIEAGQYYTSNYKDKEDETSTGLKDDVDNLTKKFEQMSLNLVDILAALGGETKEKPERKLFRRNKSPTRKEIICYRCGEKGHIASKCLSEKIKDVNNIDIESEEEYEVFPAIRRKLRSESRKEKGLLEKTPEETHIETPILEKKKKSPPKPREPSKIDQTPPYNVMDDLMTLPAHITVGQLMKYPDVKRAILKAYQRPIIKDPMVSMAENSHARKTTAVQCHVRIKSNPVKAIVDTGAAVSIMTKPLMKKLGLRIDSPSKIIVVIANGKKERALGQIHNVSLVIQGILASVTLQIIDSSNETLLLGTDWCLMTNAKVDFEYKELKINYKGKRAIAEISMEGIRKDIIPQDYEELDDEIDEMLEEEDSDEYEDESDLDERESFHADWADEVEESGIWEENMYEDDEKDLYPVVQFSKWEEYCHKGKKFAKKDQNCKVNEYHSHWKCMNCKDEICKDKPDETTHCNCKGSGKPKFVLNILYNDYGVYLSKRYSEEMKGLLQSPCGKVEEGETSIKAVWRETWEETGIDLDDKDLKFLLNDPKYNCDVYFSRLKPDVRPKRTESEKNSLWKCYSFDKYEKLAKENKTTPTHSRYIEYISRQLKGSLEQYDYTIEEVPTFLSNIEEIPSMSESFKEERIICLEEHLTKDEITKINKLLNKYNKVLASNSSELTCANVLPHEIDTGDSKLVKGALYQSPPVFDEFVKKEIDNLLRDGLIKESKSP